jgi:hypothetical protein
VGQKHSHEPSCESPVHLLCISSCKSVQLSIPPYTNPVASHVPRHPSMRPIRWPRRVVYSVTDVRCPIHGGYTALCRFERPSSSSELNPPMAWPQPLHDADISRALPLCGSASIRWHSSGRDLLTSSHPLKKGENLIKSLQTANRGERRSDQVHVCLPPWGAHDTALRMT